MRCVMRYLSAAKTLLSTVCVRAKQTARELTELRTRRVTPLRVKQLCGAVLLCAPLHMSFAAIIYIEAGDAGESIFSAQLVNSQPASTALDAIRGNLETGGADLFQIYLTGGQTFSATTSASSL